MKKKSKKTFITFLVFYFFVAVVPIYSSGGFNNGTSTGKGHLELDFTWNPFNLIKSGESYIVINYGLTNHLDFHGYLTDHPNHNNENYYYGLLYQFADTKYLDLATAIGIRQNTKLKRPNQLFFPQLLYNIKFYKDFAVGGAFINMQNMLHDKNNKLQHLRTAFDIFLHVPLSYVVKLPRDVPEIKIALGLHNRDIFDSDRNFLPTYSIDVTFKNFSIKNIVENILN